MSGNGLPWSLECSLDLSGKVRSSIQLRRVGKWPCPRGEGGGLLLGGSKGKGWVQGRRVDGGGTKGFGHAALSCPQERRAGNASKQRKLSQCGIKILEGRQSRIS